MGLIRILAILFLIYIGIRLLARFIFPLLLRYFARKATENIQEQIHEQQDGSKVYESDDVVIRQKDEATRNQESGNNSEEYIDFEDID